jgi:hypothetical protein
MKNITTSIQKFAEVVVESKPCEMVFVRRKDKEAQMMVAELSPPMSVENIVDFCPQFLYFILNYSFLFSNRTGVGLSILSNFTNSFNHFFNQMLGLIEHT